MRKHHEIEETSKSQFSHTLLLLLGSLKEQSSGTVLTVTNIAETTQPTWMKLSRR
jgi:hypothetical protein